MNSLPDSLLRAALPITATRKPPQNAVFYDIYLRIRYVAKTKGPVAATECCQEQLAIMMHTLENFGRQDKEVVEAFDVLDLRQQDFVDMISYLHGLIYDLRRSIS